MSEGCNGEDDEARVALAPVPSLGDARGKGLDDQI